MLITGIAQVTPSSLLPLHGQSMRGKNNKDVSKCLAEVSFKRLGSMPCDGALLFAQIHTRLVSELIGFGGSRSGICGSFVASDFRVWAFGVLGQGSSFRVWQGPGVI